MDHPKYPNLPNSMPDLPPEQNPFLALSGNLTKPLGALFNIYNNTQKAKKKVQHMRTRVARLQEQIEAASTTHHIGQRLDKRR